jgi:DNA modification methylase
MKPYYQDDASGITIYHGDCREVLPSLDPAAFAVLLTDPPYGIGYRSGSERVDLADSISGDEDTALRDFALSWWGERAALVFGSWRAPRPTATRTRLVWDTLGALGMGALDLPWKPSDQEIYVLGRGFEGRRDNNVIPFPPVQSLGYNGRVHPHEKPVGLLAKLLAKCPAGSVVDPFCGSGTTLRAAKDSSRAAVGVEIDERYCEIAARRQSQQVLFGGTQSITSDLSGEVKG